MAYPGYGAGYGGAPGGVPGGVQVRAAGGAEGGGQQRDMCSKGPGGEKVLTSSSKLSSTEV